MNTNPPRIVVVDAGTLNPGDLDWSRLEALGLCSIHQGSNPSEVVPRCRDATIVITNKVLISEAIIDQLPSLKYVGVTATGYNNVDTRAAKRRNIVVTNVPEYGTDSVAQSVFAHLLNLTQRTAHHAQAVADGRWESATEWCFWDFPLIELSGLTMGIIGCGRIGQATAKLAHAFGMRILGYDPNPRAGADQIAMVDLDTLFRESDVVSLHCPLTTDNERMVNADRLRLMKPTAYLINTSRGPLVDEGALADALNANLLAGAGIDVVTVEPPRQGSPLFKAKNCFVTPHIAWATLASRGRLLNTAIDNVAAFLRGAPTNSIT
jgi:glycerate dehydrogenase